VLVLLLALAASPALADDWQRYENQLYGYAVDIPPGLLWRGEGGNGDGQDFTTPTLTLILRGKLTPEGFETAIREWREWESQMGWNLMYETVTPTRASFSARRSGWLMEMRALALCSDAMVKLQVEYGTADAAAMQPVIERLARSLSSTRRC
jgi:hypothetical protein